MRKKIIAIVLSISIIIINIIPVHAEEYNLNYYMVSTWNYNNIVTYEALSDIAAQVADYLGTGQCSQVYRGGSVHLTYNGTYWYIIVWNSSRSTSWYVGSGTDRVYVALPSQITQALWNIESLCNNISNKVSTIDSNISAINTKMTNLYNQVNSIFGIMQQTYFCSYSSDGNNNPYPIIHIPKASAYQIVSALNMKMQGKKIQYISESGGYSDYYMLSAYFNQYGYIAMTITNSNQSSYYNVYLCDSRRYMYVGDIDTSSGGSGSGFDDSDIIQAIDDLQLNITNSIGDLGVTVNQSIENNTENLDPYVYASNTGGLTIKISRETANNMIAYLNNYKLGRTVYVVGSNYNTTPYLLRGAYIANDTGRIRLLLSNNDGTDNSTAVYLSNARTAKYTIENSDIESAILSIPQKLDDILEWLDNADLVTNQDLEDMIQEFQSDIDTAEGNIKNGAKLFKATFGYTDDGYSLGDILSCISTMNEFWRMPE